MWLCDFCKGKTVQKRGKTMKKALYIIVAVLMIFTCMPAMSVKAEDAAFMLNKKKLGLAPGNEYQLNLLDMAKEEELQQGFTEIEDYIEYLYYQEYLNSQCKWSSGNKKVAEVDELGHIKAIKNGKATITAEYKGIKYKCKLTVKPSKYKLSKTAITTRTYAKETLKMTYDSEVSYYYYNVYSIGEEGIEETEYNAFNIYIDEETGEIELPPLLPGDYRVDFFASVGDWSNSQNYRASCNVEVSLYGVLEKAIGCALGTQRQLTYGGLSNASFSAEDYSIVSVDSNGKVKPLAVGETTITLRGCNANGEMESFYVDVEVTDPVVTMEKDYYRVGDYLGADISGSSWYEDAIYRSSDNSIIDTSDNYCYAAGEGTATLTLIVDGKEFEFSVEIINPRLETNNFIMAKSSTKELKVLGLNKALEKEEIKYKVENKKIASISPEGIITAKKQGCTLVEVTVGDIVLEAGISVGNKKAVQAVANAVSVLGATYSQEKRMQEGYYDCSSLAWRSYSPCGVYFGEKYYAPTAANTAKYMKENNKVIADELTADVKVQPGDLIFYGGTDNGRFMNIYHVATVMGIVPGYTYDYVNEDYLPYSVEIVHAAGNQVSISTSPESYGKIVMIARPCKK